MISDYEKFSSKAINDNNTSMQLLDLPSDILDVILWRYCAAVDSCGDNATRLNYRTIARLLIVCRTFNELLSNARRWERVARLQHPRCNVDNVITFRDFVTLPMRQRFDAPFDDMGDVVHIDLIAPLYKQNVLARWFECVSPDVVVTVDVTRSDESAPVLFTEFHYRLNTRHSTVTNMFCSVSNVEVAIFAPFYTL